MSKNNDSLNNKQRQYIYDTLVNYKDSYGAVGTVANAMLAMLCATGPEGIHIKSLEGMHIAAPRTKGNSFHRTLAYIRTINTVLQDQIGPRAPQLSMDVVGNQRVKWVLASDDDNDSNDNTNNPGA